MKLNFMAVFSILLLGFFIGLTFNFTIAKEVPFVATSSQSEITLPAVDEEGNGVAVKLLVDVMPGKQRVLTNIDKLLFWVDTQQSIQTARDVAESLSGRNTSNLDIIYNIEIEESGIVGGPSAGAALAVVTVAALQNRSLNESVIITGTINPDGTIGPVGGIEEKASAAKDIGAELFLVPSGQGTETRIRPEETCTKEFGFIYCKTKYKEVTTVISEKVGIDVKEVFDVEEALEYFLI